MILTIRRQLPFYASAHGARRKMPWDAHVDDRGLRGMTEASIRDIVKRGRCICGAKIEVSEDGRTVNDAYMHILEEFSFLPPRTLERGIQNFKQLMEAEKRGIVQFYPLAEQQYKEIQKRDLKLQTWKTNCTD